MDTDAGGVLYFIYPFAGRLADERLAVIVAHRPGRLTPSSFVLTMNDNGLSLMTTMPLNLDEIDWRQVQASSGLFYDMFVRYEPDNRLLDQARRGHRAAA